MLRVLSIRDFVIVDALQLEFVSGFSVLTGETGAGKSILIDALTLALGGRSEADVVREGAAKADITAEFTIDSKIQDWLDTHALQAEEEYVLLRRVIDQAGRSKAFINGVMVTVAQLRELGDQLVDIHGQHAHQSLVRPDMQRVLLDRHAHLQQSVETVSERYRYWQNLKKQRMSFDGDAKEKALARERLAWQVGELEKLTLVAGEWEEVSQEHHRLSHAASLMEGTQETLNVLSESDAALLPKLSGLQHQLARLSEVDPALCSVVGMLDAAHIQLQEAVYEVRNYVNGLDLDPERLHTVGARLEALYSAARRFHVAPEGLFEEYQSVSAQLSQLLDESDREALLAKEREAQQEYHEAAQALSRLRQQAAAELSRLVTDVMQDLSMVGGCFSVELKPIEPTVHGVEQIEFLIAAHVGVTPRPLAKVASGGELARIALAISVITSSATVTPTLIFDEVDSGIGGAVAEVVGRLLKRLGQDRQVLCVTHLPQVASQAQCHFQVNKIRQGDHTISHITELNSSQRIEEIARMLGGVDITETTRQHAQELLAVGT